MLTFNEISKVFSTDILKKPFQALDKLSFKIDEGEIIGFLGANGAGKTTAIKIGMDFIRPTSGHIEYGKALGGRKSEAFKYIGYLPERPFFYPHLTGREFCYYMGKLSEVKYSTIGDQIKHWAPRLKIEFALDRKIKAYSKGMLQRIGYLVSLIHNPKLIVFDEPLSGLDPIGRKELKEIIVEINKNFGTTVFFSSHIVGDVEEVCNNVLFIKDGKMVFNGSVDSVINDSIKPQSKIKFYDGSDYKVEIVQNESKNEKISKIISLGHEIISIEQDKLTLEEIFYKVN